MENAAVDCVETHAQSGVGVGEDTGHVAAEHGESHDGSGVGEGGLSKAEFCEYFQAVTDLVEINRLSFVPSHAGEMPFVKR